MAKEKTATNLELTEVEPGSIAEAIQALATQAKLSGDWLRVFDIRYATAGDPIKITREYVMFPAGSVEVLETGPLAEAATSVEELGFPRMISIHGIIQAEICKRSKTKR